MKYLRVWLEDHDASHVLATKRNDKVITTDGRERRVDDLAAELPAPAWRRLSVGAGAHGPPGVRLGPDTGPDRLAGRPRALAPGPPLDLRCDRDRLLHLLRPRWSGLVDLAWIAGSRWRVEECFQQAKNDAGLDHYQAGSYRAWYAHITLLDRPIHPSLPTTTAPATSPAGNGTT